MLLPGHLPLPRPPPCRLRILKSFQLALDRFNMTDAKLPHAQPGDFTPEDRHWLKLMARMLAATQQQSAAAAAGVGPKGVKGGEGGSGAGAFSAALLVSEQDVLDVMFTVKVREGMDAVMVSAWREGGTASYTPA